jgi:hypothetical protein
MPLNIAAPTAAEKTSREWERLEIEDRTMAILSSTTALSKERALLLLLSRSASSRLVSLLIVVFSAR